MLESTQKLVEIVKDLVSHDFEGIPRTWKASEVSVKFFMWPMKMGPDDQKDFKKFLRENGVTYRQVKHSNGIEYEYELLFN